MLGRYLRICRVGSNPLSKGMATSISTIAGRNFFASATASHPFSASPTIARSVSSSKILHIPSRTAVFIAASRLSAANWILIPVRVYAVTSYSFRLINFRSSSCDEIIFRDMRRNCSWRWFDLVSGCKEFSSLFFNASSTLLRCAISLLSS